MDFLVIGDRRGDCGGESERRVKKGRDWMSGEDCMPGEDESGCESWLLSASEGACMGSGSPRELLVRRIGVIGVICGVISTERGKPWEVVVTALAGDCDRVGGLKEGKEWVSGLFTSGLRCGEFKLKESCCGASIEGVQLISGEMFSFEALQISSLFISQFWS